MSVVNKNDFLLPVECFGGAVSSFRFVFDFCQVHFFSFSITFDGGGDSAGIFV